MRYLVEERRLALLAVLGIPGADLGPFATGIALSGGSPVGRCLQAHSGAIVDLVVLDVS